MKRNTWHLKSKVKQQLLIMKSLVKLIRRKQLGWLVYTVENRLQYRLNALQVGIRMNRSGQADLFNLRRNIHRLEKGLSHITQKDYFAEAYIIETVNYLEKLLLLNPEDNNLLFWSVAVLENYFAVTSHTPAIKAAHERFLKIKLANQHPDWHPYSAANRPALTVNYDDFLQLGLRRRSVRNYLDRPVGFEEVKKAMEIAALAPSACNRQPFHFLFYNEQEIVRQIAAIPGGAAGFNLPGVVIVIGRYRAYFDERDAAVPVIDASLSVMSFLFACETLGLSSVCINWPNLPDRDRRIRRLIQLGDDEFVVMLIGVGYADPIGKIPFSAKHDVNTLISCNERIRETSHQLRV